MTEKPRHGEGVLYVVATPIGNLGDISSRALEVLASVDLVAAEDTRHSRKLLQHFGIKVPMLALHDFNERDRSEGLLDRLAAGECIALISDAGTPLICDPGFLLVREARDRGIKVVPVPGACAMVAALSAAGLPTDRFVFEGFLPARRKARRDRLETLRHENRTLVFYESPHRIRESLDDAAAILGTRRQAVLARELTKTFETFVAADLGELGDRLAADSDAGRGEMVLMIAGASDAGPEPGTESLDIDRLLLLLQGELGVKKAARLASEITGLAKNQLYQRALALGDKTSDR